MLHFLKSPKLNVPSGPRLTQLLCKISLQKLAITKNMFETKRLGQGLAHEFPKEPDRKYFWFYGSYNPCHHYSTLLFE